MNEKIPSSSVEKIHNEREILNLLESIIQGEYEILRSLEDEDGLYILEVKTTDESGDTVMYSYIRAGKYPEGSSTETVIDVIFYDGDMQVGGHPITKYKEGKWVNEVE